MNYQEVKTLLPFSGGAILLSSEEERCCVQLRFQEQFLASRIELLHRERCVSFKRCPFGQTPRRQ